VDRPRAESARGRSSLDLTPKMQVRVSMMFDSYIKKCSKNELLNIEDHKRRIKEKEVLVSDVISIKVDTKTTGLTVPDFIVEGYEIAINNELLLEALKKLDSTERELILLLFYIGYKPKEVSTDLHIGERAVNKRKNKILAKLRRKQPIFYIFW